MLEYPLLGISRRPEGSLEATGQGQSQMNDPELVFRGCIPSLWLQKLQSCSFPLGQPGKTSPAWISDRKNLTAPGYLAPPKSRPALQQALRTKQQERPSQGTRHKLGVTFLTATGLFPHPCDSWEHLPFLALPFRTKRQQSCQTASV